MSKLTTRLTAMLLAGMLVIGSVPGSVLAASTDVDPGQTSEIAQDVYDEEASEAPVSDGEMAESEDTSEESASAGETAQPEEESEAPAGARKTAEESLTEDAEEAQYYTVILDANGGCFENEWDDVLGETVESTKVLNKNVPIGEAVDTFPVSDQENSVVTFLGWSLERDGEIVSQEFVPVENCILYAVWSVEKYSDANDEELESSTEDVAVEDANNQDAESPLTEDQNAEFADESADQTEESETEEALQEQFEEEYVQQEEAADEEPIQEVVTHVIENNPEEDVEKSGHSGADSNKETEPKTLSQESEQKKEAEEESVSSPSMTNAEDVTTSIIPDDAEEYNGNYYYIFDDALTWKEAKSACETRGGHLVTITNEEENDFIIDLIKGHDVQGKYHFWAGGTDEGHEGTWTWITGEQWQYTCWEPDQPNNADGNSSGGQDYLEIWHIPGYSSVLWNDEPDDGYSDHSPEAPYYLSLPYYSYICEWDSTTPKLDYLEVGFNGKVTVHWIYKGESDAISGFEVQHRWEGSDGIRTTKVSGSNKREVDIVDLSYNIYEFRIRAVSSKQDEAESDSGWSEWAKCPVKEIKFERLEPGSSNVDSFSFKGIINFGTNICIHENHKAAVYEIGKSESPVISLPFELSDYYTDNLTLETNPHSFFYNTVYSINPSEITKLDAGKNYHIAIDEKAIEYVDDNYDRYNEDIPIYFAGIDKSDSSTWSFSTINLSYPGLENPGENSNHSIPEKYYKLLFGPEDYKDIRKKDDGSGGICFGLCYTVGAYQDGLSYINKIVSDNLMLPDISAHTGDMRLSDVPIGEGSKLIEYIRMAHLFQYRPEYIIIKKDKEKVNSLYKAIKEGKNVIISVKKQKEKKKEQEKGHVVYSPGILSGGGSSPINIPVYDPSTGGNDPFIKTVTLSSDAKKMELYGEYDTFNWYYEIVPEVDEKIEEYINSWDYNMLSYGEYTFMTSTKELEEQDNLIPLFSENGDSNNEGLYCYWLEGNSYHINDVTEETTITISDGKNKIYTSLSSGQSADLDISNNTVQIDENSEGAYQIRFSYASSYEDFSDIIVSGELRAEGAFISKTDDGLKVETEDNAEIEVKTEDNNEETGSMMLILPSGGAEIHTEEDELRAYSDEDGNGIFSDRIVLPLDSSKVSINGISSKSYTGSAIVQIPVVKLGSITLKEKKDYTVSHANNTNAGTATVTITGKGNYTGTVSKTFKINSASIANAAVSGISNKTYTGSAITQNPTVKVGDKTLKKGTDYTISYANNTNVGTATVTITGKGNYASKKTATFKINKAAQSITAKARASRVAVGKTTTVSITGNKGKKSYKSSNTAIATVDSSTGKVTAKKVGTVKITATSAATANYKATSKTVTIKVVPAATASLTAANQATGIKLTWKKVTGANGYKVYRGSTLIKTITSGSTVTFADTKANTNGTKYTYKVVAKATTGDSTLSKSRVIYRVSRPAVSSVTNNASKKMTVKWGKNAKANGYQIQYSTDKTFKSGNKAVSITSASTVSKVIGSLIKGKTYYVRIRTYKTVGSTKYWSIWSAARSVKVSK